MKSVYIIIAILVCLSMYASGYMFGASHCVRQGFEVQKTKQGYDIYKNGELEWEFTRENTDSLSLHTLKMIYEGD